MSDFDTITIVQIIRSALVIAISTVGLSYAMRDSSDRPTSTQVMPDQVVASPSPASMQTAATGSLRTQTEVSGKNGVDDEDDGGLAHGNASYPEDHSLAETERCLHRFLDRYARDLYDNGFS